MVTVETGTTPPPTGSSRLSSSTVLVVAARGRLPRVPRRHRRQRRVPEHPGVVRRAPPSASCRGCSTPTTSSWPRSLIAVRSAGRPASVVAGCSSLGVALFTLSRRVLCAAAESVLLAGRRPASVQALGAAMLIPASLALVIEALPLDAAGRTPSVCGARAAAVAAGLGPTDRRRPGRSGGTGAGRSWSTSRSAWSRWSAAAPVAGREPVAPAAAGCPTSAAPWLLAVALALLTTGDRQRATTGAGPAPPSLLCLVGSAAAAAGFVLSSRSPPVAAGRRRAAPRCAASSVANVAVDGRRAWASTPTCSPTSCGCSTSGATTSSPPGLALVPGRAGRRRGRPPVLGPVAQRPRLPRSWWCPAPWCGPRPTSGTSVVRRHRARLPRPSGCPGQVLSGIGVGATLPAARQCRRWPRSPVGGYATRVGRQRQRPSARRRPGHRRCWW